jgi:hypothetical protein
MTSFNKILEKMDIDPTDKNRTRVDEPCPKCGGKNFAKDGGVMKCTKCGTKAPKSITEKRMSDEEGDYRYQCKKDDELDRKAAKCKCGKDKNKCKCNGKCSGKCSCKESKFDQYIIEQTENELDVIFEKLGSLDAMDAKEIGLPANTVITFDMIKGLYQKLCKSGKCEDADSYANRIKKFFVGITPEELAKLKLVLKNAVINIPTGKDSDEFGGPLARQSN